MAVLKDGHFFSFQFLLLTYASLVLFLLFHTQLICYAIQ